MGEYFEVVEKQGFLVNYAPLVGHRTVSARERVWQDLLLLLKADGAEAEHLREPPPA